MNNNHPTHRQFHPVIADAYTFVHDWLAGISQANGYRDIDPRGKWKAILQGDSLKSVAFQYYYLFATHYFKTVHILKTVVSEDLLLSWIKHKQRFCILDIGCGAGAGSAALIETILTLKEQGKISTPISIYLIGVDPDGFSILLYKQLIKNLSSLVVDDLDVKFSCVKDGFPDATLGIIKNLKSELSSYNLPCLSNLLAIQLNVISPFSETFRNREAEYRKILEIDPEICEFLTEVPERFGHIEACAYKQIIEDVPIDMMHVLTIATKNLEKYVQHNTNSETALEERVREMSCTLRDVMGQRHKISLLSENNYQIFFENPIDSYWRDKKNIHKTNNPIKFYADINAVFSADREEDKEWNDVISIDNLKSAWAKARHNLLGEALIDEVELRLLEVDPNTLEERLRELQDQLHAYDSKLVHSNDLLPYSFPKNSNSSRPRGLSRIEEEILSTAIIQRLGDKVSQLRGNSYAYKISRQYGKETEYLYENWFNAYKLFIKKTQSSAHKYPNGSILRVDIESFYMRII